MSEDILNALGRLFAIVAKQDNGATERERQFVARFFQLESNRDSIQKYLALYDACSAADPSPTGKPSVPDVVTMLRICRTINTALTARQKVVVVMKLVDLAWTCKQASASAMEVVNTISVVLNISEGDYTVIQSFIRASREPGVNSMAA